MYCRATAQNAVQTLPPPTAAAAAERNGSANWQHLLHYFTIVHVDQHCCTKQCLAHNHRTVKSSPGLQLHLLLLQQSCLSLPLALLLLLLTLLLLLHCCCASEAELRHIQQLRLHNTDWPAGSNSRHQPFP
jgi:hypothetical protein